MGNPLPESLPQEAKKAQKVLSSFVDPVDGLDRVVPMSVLRKAKGFAIFSVFRIGFLMSARAGSGIVIAKAEDGSWTAPSAIGIGGLGGGFNAGAEVTDFLIVLNSRAAVQTFMATGSLRLGGNLSVAVGPMGRSAEASGAVSTGGKVAAMYSYSRSKGLYGGISVEGTVLVDRTDANVKAYGRNGATAKQILSGSVDIPMFCEPLIATLERLTQSGRAAEAALADAMGQTSLSSDSGYIGSSGRADIFDNYSAASAARRDSSVEERNGWTNSMRLKRDEAETRNLGAYAFGGIGASNTNTAPVRASSRPSFGRNPSTDYAKEKKERPSKGRTTSSGSFSFLRKSSPVQTRTPPPPAHFPTYFERSSMSSEESSKRPSYDHAYGAPSQTARASHAARASIDDPYHSHASSSQSSIGAEADGFDTLDRELQRGSSRTPRNGMHKWKAQSFGGQAGMYGASDAAAAYTNGVSKSARRDGAAAAAAAATQRDPFAKLYDEANSRSSHYQDDSWASVREDRRATNNTTPRAGTTSTQYPNQRSDSPLLISPSTPPTSVGYSSPSPAMDRVCALFDFQGQESDDLSFRKGDIILVSHRTASREEWWDGICAGSGKKGSFPANYTEDV